MVVDDLPEPFEAHVFRKGNPSRLGDPAPREFIRVVNRGEPVPFNHGSGRLELARAIASAENPLTARVLVNRLWMHHFGDALVASTTDFGVRSEPPAQPELLDWLASDFIRSGWSIKHLHRVIVLSSAYQQASEAGGEFPGHFVRQRLDFEAMRDTMLYVAGRLDTTAGGRPEDVAGDPACRPGPAGARVQLLVPGRRRDCLPCREAPRLVVSGAAADPGAGDGPWVRGCDESGFRAGAGSEQDLHLFPVLTW